MAGASHLTPSHPGFLIVKIKVFRASSQQQACDRINKSNQIKRRVYLVLIKTRTPTRFLIELRSFRLRSLQMLINVIFSILEEMHYWISVLNYSLIIITYMSSGIYKLLLVSQTRWSLQQ